MKHNMEEIKKIQAEMVTSFQERGWKDAARIVKGYTDPVDINYAYKWYKKADDETTFWTAMTYD